MKPLEHYELSESNNALNRIIKTKDMGLYSDETLSIINNIFCKKPISHKTTREQILTMYDKVSIEIESKLGIDKISLRDSAIIEWPLYYLLKSKK